MTEHQVASGGLGSRISARFVVVGLHEEISELRRQPVFPAEFDDQ